MDVTIRQNPAFAVARCQLASGEGMKADAGAMMAHSIGVEVEAKVQGGLMKGLKRSILGGESLFQTTWTAPDGGGWVDCTANLPGDLAVLDVDAHHGNGTQELFYERADVLVEDERIVFAYDLLLEDRLTSVSLTTVEFFGEEGGTRLLFTEQGAFFDGLDDPAEREHGTGWLLDRLGRVLAGEPVG